MHLSTGFVGTPYLNHVLTRFGRSDVAYALLMQKTLSVLAVSDHAGRDNDVGALGRVDARQGFQRHRHELFNHYAFGAVGAWMYQIIAGIDLDEARPGYKHIVIRPQPGGGLTFARAKLKSVYGEIASEWRIDAGKQFHLDVTIPPNATATVSLPGGATHEVGAGKHAFKSEWSLPPRPSH
jgi:alpha-L-rhamnosidase